MKFPTAEIKDTEGNTWHQEEGRLRRLNQGVEGAHLCTSFQCELCWFRNLTGKDPTPGVHDMAIRCLRRCNLDNFAGRAPSTIRGHKLEIFTLLKKFESVGMPLLLQPLGPLPVGDKVGMGIALGMQLKSITAKGRIVDSVQFATVRGVRGTATLNGRPLLWEWVNRCRFLGVRVVCARPRVPRSRIGSITSCLAWSCAWGLNLSRIRP